MSVKYETIKAPEGARLPRAVGIEDSDHAKGHLIGSIPGEQVRVGGYLRGKGGFLTPPEGSSHFVEAGQADTVTFRGPITNEEYELSISGI